MSNLTTRTIRVALIGFGRMGLKFFKELHHDPRWEIVYICDLDDTALTEAAALSPGSKFVKNADVIFSDENVEVVVLTTLADSRGEHIRKAIAAGKHIIAEKPVADNNKTEWELVKLVEDSGLLVAVNMFNRNAWYHKEIIDFINSGEIGELAIVRICHMTPGFVPGEGHEHEGPSFHDCGMHYVDVARWYAASEYDTWHAQGIRMWSYKDPWWIQCHGTFKNGVVFDITQGFVYGHLAREQTHNSYVDVIGTKGVARMTHDFNTATVDLRGVNRCEVIERPFYDKKMNVLCDVFARSVIAGCNLGFPVVRDSVVASEYAWKMVENARQNGLPKIGTIDELHHIVEYRKTLTNGYGLPGRK